MEGVKLLKARKKYEFTEYTEGCVKGMWQQRLATYRQLFGRTPQFLEDSIAELEQLRMLRNAVGHAFGRSPGAPKIGKDVVPEPAKRIKHERLLAYLELAHNAAECIEAHLTKDYIGSYESIAMYHHWDRRGDGWKLDQRRFRAHFGKTVRPGISLPYFMDLVTFYRKM